MTANGTGTASPSPSPLRGDQAGRVVQLAAVVVAAAVVLAIGVLAGRGLWRLKQSRDAVAFVNDAPLSRSAWEARWADYAGTGDIPGLRFNKQAALEDLIQVTAVAQAAEREGCLPTAGDLRQQREQLVQEELGALQADPDEMSRFLRSEGLTLETYRRRLQHEIPASPVRELATEGKLRQKVTGGLQVSEEELRDSFRELERREILVSPDELRRRAQAVAERAGKPLPQQDWKAQARQQAESALARLRAGEAFATVAKEVSHEPTSAGRGGRIGFERADRLLPEMAEALRALKPGQVSGIIESQFGFYLVRLERERLELPPDFAQRQEQYRADVLDWKRRREWARYADALLRGAKVDVRDLELRAYAALDAPRPDVGHAAQLLTQTLATQPDNAGARFELALLRKQQGQATEALDQLRELLRQSPQAAGTAAVHFELGSVLRALDKRAEAVEELKQASALAAAGETPSDQFLHASLYEAFTELGEKALAEKERKWLQQSASAQPMTPWGGGVLGPPPTDRPPLL